MLTHNVKPDEIVKNWVIVDAKGQSLGRVSTEIARILRGKHKPNFVPYLDCGDNVIVINAEKVVLTGRKLKQKHYYRYSGYIGGLKSISAEDLLAKYPERLLEASVKGMLPKNKLSRSLLTNLKIYAGESHPHAAQNPVAASPRLAGQAVG